MPATDVAGPAQTRAASAGKLSLWLLVFLLICLGVGCYAQMLNVRLYAHDAPFYDSIAYNEAMHTIMRVRREQGVAPALAAACRIHTVFIPNAVAALLPTSIDPSRAIGVWLQTSELLALLCSVFYYLTRIKNQTACMAVILLSPLLALRCLYVHNGGMSDFRMDLSLFFTFSLTAVWYLIAAETGRKLHYLVLGLCAGLTCLFRATAPVYLIVAIGPLVVLDMLRTSARRSAWIGLAIAVSAAAAASVWFYVSNFRLLYYYYFIWNKDANAGLSWQESLRHFEFVGGNMGEWTIRFVLAYYAVLAIQWLLDGRWLPMVDLRSVRDKLVSLDLRLLWLGIGPAALLVLQGAGLNPYVCMPSMFGTLLFALMPFGCAQAISSKRLRMLLGAIAVFCCVATAKEGWREHGIRHGGSMAAHQQTLQTIIADALARGGDRATFGTLHSHWMNTNSLYNVLMFDVQGARVADTGILINGLELQQNLVFSAVVAEATWKEIPGSNCDSKLDTLVEKAIQTMDYLILPDQKTATFVQNHIFYNLINRHSVDLRERILRSGQFEKISGDIVNGPDEVVNVYRNSRSSRMAGVTRNHS